MKKTYSKPDILFDSFALNTSISATCEKPANFQSDVCGYEYTDLIVVFTTEVNGCKAGIALPENELFDGICYHNPSDLNNLFVS